ncbi:MAG: hypothetical protein R6V85_06690 [Polyangia bacterium]
MIFRVRPAIEFLFGERARFATAVVAISLVAFGLRLYWALELQPPGEAIFSDMRSYIFRAVWLLCDLQEVSETRKLDVALFPWGVHYYYAFQMWLFGLADSGLADQMQSRMAGLDMTAMAVVQASISSLAATFSMLAARRCFSSLLGAVIVGAAAALWYPQITYSGYFTSEAPFSCAVALSLWLWIRYAQTGRGAWAAGLSQAVGFTLRPKMLMTSLLCLAWLVVRQRRLDHFRWRHLAWISIPIALVVAFSVFRYHHFTGEVALISGNAPIGRFFAATDYGHIEADNNRSFYPPARTSVLGCKGVFRFEGYIADAEKLDPERRSVWRSKSFFEKLSTVRRNIIALAYGNRMWPEYNWKSYAGSFAEKKRAWELQRENAPRKHRPAEIELAGSRAERRMEEEQWWRPLLANGWRRVAPSILLPLAALGMALLARRFKPGLELASLYVATLLYASAMYFGEIRYRIPYDPVLILLGTFPLLTALRKKRWSVDQDRWVRYTVLALLAVVAIMVLVPFDSIAAP